MVIPPRYTSCSYSRDGGERVITDCVFCQIIAGNELAQVIADWADAIAIVPLDPVTPGHLLVIPRVHVIDFTTEPTVTATAMARASEIARHLRIFPANLITSAGREATQSVFHLHVHVVPRRQNDGLALPWYSGKTKRSEATS